MAENIVRLRLDSGSYDAKIKRAREGILDMEAACRKTGGTLEFVEKEQLDYIKSLGQMDTSARGLKGRINELTSAYTDLRGVYNRLTSDEKKSPFGEALNKSLSQLKDRTAAAKGEISSISKELGGNGLSGSLESLTGKFGLSIGKIGTFGVVLGAAKAAAEVAKDAFFATEGGIDEWGRSVEGAKGAYTLFLNTLNNGGWSNFFENLNTAVQGARDLYDALDRLSSVKTNNQAAIAIQRTAIQDLRLRKSKATDPEEIAELEREMETRQALLASLNNQEVTAGKAAGRKQIYEAINNSALSTGVKLRPDVINYAIDKILNEGQSYIEWQGQNYSELKAKGTYTDKRYYPTPGTGFVSREKFDINRLSDSDKIGYALAKAIIDAETSIGIGIGTYANAVNTQAGSYKEEIKTQRYIESKAPNEVKEAELLPTGAIEKWQLQIKELNSDLLKATTPEEYSRIKAGIDSISTLMSVFKGESVLEGVSAVPDFSVLSQNNISGYVAALKEQLSGAEIGSEMFDVLESKIDNANIFSSLLAKSMEMGLDTSSFSSMWEALLNDENFEELFTAALDRVKEAQGEQQTTQQQSVDIKLLSEKISTLGSGLGSIQGGLRQLGVELPKGVQTLISVIQGVGSIIQGVQSVISVFQTSALAANTAAIVANTTALSVNSGMKLIPFLRHGGLVYAKHGFVPGNDYSDGIPAMLSSGELVLNAAQQGNLASQLEDNRRGAYPSESSPYLTGELIFLGLNNYLRRIGRGEIITAY